MAKKSPTNNKRKHRPSKDDAEDNVTKSAVARRRKMSIEDEDAEVDAEHEHRLMENAEISSAEEEDHELLEAKKKDKREDSKKSDEVTKAEKYVYDLDEVNESSGDEKEEDMKFESDGKYRNKQRCLVMCSRGVTARYRHLLEDLRTLLPHHKRDAKLDPGKGKTGGMGIAVNEIAEMKSCNTMLFLECRKHKDCYMWLGNTPNGPSAKFHISNIHTMDELRLTGNCMKGSRPVLSFDESFDRVHQLKLLKVLFTDVFGTPRGHPKSKPFVDRVMSFYFADNKIWVRNYQVMEEQATNAKEAADKKHNDGLKTSLVEIGPRFVMNPIRIFSGSFTGQTLYQNGDFVSPNEVRAEKARELGGAYKGRKMSEKMRKDRHSKMIVPEDPLNSVFKK